MATEIIKQLEEWVLAIIAEDPALFLVSIKTRPTNNFKVFVDGDLGLPIEVCAQINRKLYKLLEEAAIYPDGDFSLEVSSPGLSEPLKLIRQYQKNIERDVEVVFKDGSIKEGKLLAVAEADIIIEQITGKGKKAVVQQLVIPLNNIKTTTVQVKF